MIGDEDTKFGPPESFGLWSMPRSAWAALPQISLPTAAELARSWDPVKEQAAAARRRKVFVVPVSEATWWRVID